MTLASIKSRVHKALGIDKIKALEFDKIISQRVALEVAKEMIEKRKRILGWTPKTIYKTRQDVKSWNESQALFFDAEWQRSYAIQILFDDILIDALLTSQIENRKNLLHAAEFSLLKGEAVDKKLTKKLKKSSVYRKINNAILDSIYKGFSVIEFEFNKKGKLDVTDIERTNVTPANGRFFKDYMQPEDYILYRELPEYGKWILEFNSGDIGLLNKAVPHVLFKRFAQSCHSELCEIYGIPPRVMKTNTADKTMLDRAEKMMNDMGSAAWFIIDETETFEFAKLSGDVSGDVYGKLINLCNSENSMLISGAIIGQDTEHGNRSKDETAQDVLWNLVKSDMELVEQYWNETVMPALVKIGFLPEGLEFSFNPTEDIKQLFEFVKGLLPFKKIKNEWIKEKFGVEVEGDKESTGSLAEKLSHFFD